MITKNNISLLFDFIKRQKKIIKLGVNFKDNDFTLNTFRQSQHITIKNNTVSFDCKIDKSLEEIANILIPILIKNKKFFIGQIGQSLDGRIALLNGNSHYINNKKSITYLHCLRSICDAVVVGVNTIIKDNPSLTTRKVKGRNPQRIIIDPTLKLTNRFNIFKDNYPNIIFTYSTISKKLNNTKIYKLPKKNFTKHIHQKINSLNFKYVLVEGGAATLSKFLDARLLNIMQFIISPMIIGSGINSLNLKPITDLKNALRVKNNIHKFGDEIIISLKF